MRAVDLAQVADELYALAPADFRAARDERATQARAAGNRQLADSIKKLRRPTVSAWLVNMLVREAAARVEALLELAEPLREAQQTLAADRLRELSAQRRNAIAAITQEAKRLAARARQSFSAQVEREVGSTLEAALADPDAAEAVRSGRLTSALSYAGLGGADLSAALAVPAASPVRSAPPPGAARPPHAVRPALPVPGKPSPGRAGQEERAAAERQSAAAQRKAREADRAELDLRDATAIAQEAEAALEEADRRLAGAREQHQAAARQIGELQRRLEQTEAREATLARTVTDARRSRDAAARSLETAQRRLARARAKLREHR